eukprot:1160540-Pelagomonas_calceolata.AAC.3
MPDEAGALHPVSALAVFPCSHASLCGLICLRKQVCYPQCRLCVSCLPSLGKPAHTTHPDLMLVGGSHTRSK